MKIIFTCAVLWIAATLNAQPIFLGRVVDQCNLKAIAHAKVTWLQTGQITTTNATGDFSFDLHSLPDITFLIDAPSFETKTISIQMEEWKERLIIPLERSHLLDVDEVQVNTKIKEVNNRHLFPVSYVKIADLSGGTSVNLMESLSKIPGVYSSNTGPGISKPVIRGMQGMRVVTYLNGLRLEGQQWGSDHGLGMAEWGIGSVEVIKGPASLLYGSDAMGGVLYLLDESYASNGKEVMQFQQVGYSNTWGSSTRFLYKKSGAKFRSLVGLGYTTHADYQLPNKNFAYNTRYQEIFVKGSLSWNTKASVQFVRFSSNQMQIGIPGETTDSLIQFNHFQVKNSTRSFIAPMQLMNNHSASFEKKWFHESNEVAVIFGQTLNQLSEFEDTLGLKAMCMNLWNSSYQLKWTKKWKERVVLMSGCQGMTQFNRNNPVAEERLMPNAISQDQGIYSVLKFNLNEKWSWTTGIRYDVRYIHSFDSIHGNGPFEHWYQSPNGAIGLHYIPAKSTDFNIHLTSGYRTPHLTELLADGFHHGALRYEIGNSQLKPERATQLDVAWNWHSKHVDVLINPFYSRLQQFIYLNPIDSLIGNMPVFLYQQTNQLGMYGMDASIHYHPHQLHHLHLESSFSYLTYSNKGSSSVSLIPQPRLINTIHYHFDFGNKWKLTHVELTHTSCFKQTHVAVFEQESPFYQLLNASIHVAYSGKNPLEIAFSVKNILNVNYIDHLSRLKNIGLLNQGRNFVLSVKWTLS
ncbi:MAG: TonB-dependent receptor domain-containing protein [Flavobacteriales bacterium]